MIGTVSIKCNAAKPNFPLQPMFAFQGSPSSIRILDVPKSVGEWAITSVKVAIEYPDNTTIEKSAVRNGSVWVATVEGCEVAGKVLNGYSVLADGIDEDGNDVTGYVLGKGDVFILENNTELSRLVGKIAVRYVDDIPDVPTKGDLMNSNGVLRLFDGNDWIVISTGEHSAVYDSQITIQKNGTSVGSFTVNASEPKSIDIQVPSRTSDIVNDSGFITASAIPSQVSEFDNDVGYITASEVVIPSNLSDFNNDVGYITASAISGKRDYTDLSYNKYDTSDHTYRGITSWEIKGLKIGSQTYNITTVIRGTGNPTYGTYWNNGAAVVYTHDLTTFYFANGGDALTSFTLSPSVFDWTGTWEDSYGVQNVTFHANTDFLALKSGLPTNVSELENDVGYLTASSSAFVAKRDKTDMSAVVGTTYASWNLSALHGTTYSPALELKWGTYNFFGEKQECWLVDDEYRQLCFFLMPDLTMLFWGVKNQDGSYNAGYGETITLSSDELSIATINGVAEITCTRTSKDGSPETSTIATMKDLQGFQNINEKRDWWDNTYQASVDATGKYTINKFSVVIGGSSYNLDQFSAIGGTSTWKSSSSYPTITTTDGLNFALNTDSSTTANFTMGDLKPGPAKGIVGGSNFNVYANFKLTTFALKDYVDSQIGSVLNEQF